MTESDVERGHLSQDQLEAFLPRLRDEAGGPPPEQRRHLEACERCRHELDRLEALDEALAGLPELRPSPGFTEAVMARVELPAPWYRRIWTAVLDRWVLLAVLLAGGGATAGGAAWWVAARPEMTWGGLTSFVLERVSTLFWTAVVAAGRLLWASGIADSLRALAGTVEPLEGLAAMAVLSACAATAGVVMAKLMDVSPPRLGAAGS